MPASHGLNASISRHKVRISAELTKARLRRGCGNLEQLRRQINKQATAGSVHGETTTDNARHPRWVRVNTLRTTLDEQLRTTFAEFARANSVQDVISGSDKTIVIDKHIPNLLAVSPHIDLTTTKAYKSGQIILQDKASCFPAYLLSPDPEEGDVIDACAAPGNKTTHAAAILAQGCAEGKVIACEKDALRSQTLEKMTRLAGGEGRITVKAKQDFMKLDPTNKEFANVTALLLDPSCSGSGIVGREEGGITVHLPSTTQLSDSQAASKGKKRKREKPDATKAPNASSSTQGTDQENAMTEQQPLETEDSQKLASRLTNLSAFQLRLLQHAMAFPAARRITYSTCSIHAEENEHVVVKALLSPVAKERGWWVLRRDEQVDGMQRWQKRGWQEACVDATSELDPKEVSQSCIRCEKGDGEGTMGFFVAGFVRDECAAGGETGNRVMNGDADDEEEWEGFED